MFPTKGRYLGHLVGLRRKMRSSLIPPARLCCRRTSFPKPPAYSPCGRPFSVVAVRGSQPGAVGIQGSGRFVGTTIDSLRFFRSLVGYRSATTPSARTSADLGCKLDPPAVAFHHGRRPSKIGKPTRSLNTRNTSFR